MIYEDEEKYEKTPHISYKEYKKKLEKNPNEGIILFVSAFFVMLLIFLGIAKQLSPDVDVSIGNNTGDESVTDDIAKGNVDERLRIIQMEDNAGVSDEVFSPELEEKVVLPDKKEVKDDDTEVIVLEPSEKKVEEKPPVAEQNTVTEHKPATEQAAQPAAVSQPAVNAKVIVGYYATAEQAEVAKGIIQEAGLNIQPFVKNIGAAYTLQVGSFSSREKAQSVANDLLKNNFPARVIIE